MSGWKDETSATPEIVMFVQPFAFLPIFAPLALPSASRSAIHSGGNQWAWTSMADIRLFLFTTDSAAARGFPFPRIRFAGNSRAEKKPPPS